MSYYIWETPEEINKSIAERLRNIRKRRKLSQQQLSERCCVSYGSIKRFEITGQISLLHLTRIAVALGCVDEMKQLFTEIPYLSIEEVIHEYK